VIQPVPSVEQEHATLLRRGPGQLGHKRASDDGYEVTEDVTGMSVLLVNDTFTSGPRAEAESEESVSEKCPPARSRCHV
jgi:hypothetical protein